MDGMLKKSCSGKQLLTKYELKYILKKNTF